MERFVTHIGTNINPEYLCRLSDAELAAEIKNSGEWDIDLVRDLCWRADIIELDSEDADIGDCALKAAAKLGVDIGGEQADKNGG